MDSFELNKVAGAVLGTLLFAMGSGFVAELIYHPKPAGNAGYALPEPAPAESAAAPAAAQAEPIAVRLAGANAEKGQAGSKACVACHSFDKGGANKVGPGLWDIVERQKAGHAGFEYSAALKEKGGTWTYADLDGFLENPKAYAKGTKMAYAGITSPQERGNVIAYLRNLADSPKPLPVAEKKDAAPAEAKSEAKPAEAKPDSKPEGDKPVANKPSEGKDSPAKPGDPKSPDATPAEAKPAEATTTRNDPAPAQPSEPKPATEAPAAPPAPEAPAEKPAQ